MINHADAWAVGMGPQGRPTAAIILSWSGSASTKVNVPKVGAIEKLDSASAARGGTLTWAFGRSTDSQGVVSNLTLRNGW